jgi:hypothetical protein
MTGSSCSMKNEMVEQLDNKSDNVKAKILDNKWFRQISNA